MKKTGILLLFFLNTFLFYGQVKKIYISDLLGNDSTSLLSEPTVTKTLKGAYDLLPDLVDKEYHIILKKEGDISLGANNLISFTWTKSGTSDYPIKIYSEEDRVVIKRPSGNAVDIIKFRDIQYVHISNITFQNVTHGFLWDNVDHSSVKYCEFIGDVLDNHNDGAAIWIGKDVGQDLYLSNEYTINPNYKSEYNEIAYNYIHSQKVNNHCGSHRHHGFYISHGSDNNKFIGNTLDNPLGSGIQMNHGYQKSNIIASNFIYKEFYQPNNNDFLCLDPQGVDESDPNIPPDNAYDKINNSKFGIILGYQDENVQTGTMVNNEIYTNYVYLNDNFGISSANTYNGNRFIAWEFQDIDDNNAINNNTYYFGDQIFPKDPYWISFDPEKITNKTVSGDYDGDGKDDIAAFYDNGAGNTDLRLWTSSTQDFVYHGNSGWWQETTGGYDINKIEGRVVSGDYNGDGKDDIASFYDNGNGDMDLHVWLSEGNKFKYQWSAGWWLDRQGSYDVNKITDRVVSGDYNGDGKDDIAAFYDNGNGDMDLHVWLSEGNKFKYQWSAGWWLDRQGSYDVNKITDRVVSGDYNGDGKDDIAAFYDNGNGDMDLHVWLSEGNKFKYQWSAGWWLDRQGSYDVNKITDRVVSGDYNGDGKDDIASFYDNGNGNTDLHVWLSEGNKFKYQWSAGWWQETKGGYDVNKITGRVVSGDYNGDGKSDIVAFYNYEDNNSVRTNAWHSKGNNFAYINSSLGYTWKIIASPVSKNYEQITVEKPKNEIVKNRKGYQVFKISPNPISNSKHLYVTSTQKLNQSISITIFDIQGKKISIVKQKLKKTGSTYRVAVENLVKGIYFIKIKSKDIDETYKFLKD